MAIYFKCPNCGHKFIDMFGENAATDDINGDYLCPKCDSPAENISYEEYRIKED